MPISINSHGVLNISAKKQLHINEIDLLLVYDSSA